VSATPCASPPPWPTIFSDYSFRVHHLVNRDDRQLLAHAMASDFSVAWQLEVHVYFHNSDPTCSLISGYSVGEVPTYVHTAHV
jgi:hypothetical protein